MSGKHLKKIKSEMAKLEEGTGWKLLHKEIGEKSANFPCFVGKARVNLTRNRYSDIFPFDYNRVSLLNDVSSNYVNASFVEVPRAGRRYILTQNPLPHTSGHFWRMVWEQNSKTIVMLNKIFENSRTQGHQYWPSDGVLKFPDVDLCVTHVSEEKSGNFVVRSLRLEDITTSESRNVLQLHYTTWPVYGVPWLPLNFLKFLKVVRERGAFNADVGPPVVHCSAGAGRSGTFCLADSCLEMMKQDVNINIKDVLVDMRNFRMHLVHGPDQLKFAYMVIIEGLQEKLQKERLMQDEKETNNATKVDDKSVPPKQSFPNFFSLIAPRVMEGVEVAAEAQVNYL